MTSPTQRSLALLRREGWLVGVVEKWNAHLRIRQDLFGFVDLLAFQDAAVLFVQTTTAAHITARIAKAQALPAFATLLAMGHAIEFHGWAKRGPRRTRKRWTVTRRAFGSSICVAR